MKLTELTAGSISAAIDNRRRLGDVCRYVGTNAAGVMANGRELKPGDVIEPVFELSIRIPEGAQPPHSFTMWIEQG